MIGKSKLQIKVKQIERKKIEKERQRIRRERKRLIERERQRKCGQRQKDMKCCGSRNKERGRERDLHLPKDGIKQKCSFK